MTTSQIENGRKQYDTLQANCSATVQMTDEQLSERVKTETEMFGATDAEAIRANARNVQDKLDRQGRESFAAEYAAEQAKNQ